MNYRNRGNAHMDPQAARELAQKQLVGAPMRSPGSQVVVGSTPNPAEPATAEATSGAAQQDDSQPQDNPPAGRFGVKLKRR